MHASFYNAVSNCAVWIDDNVPFVRYSNGGNNYNSITFKNSKKYNGPVKFPNGVESLYECFYGCHPFNQSITIPNGVTNCMRMFQYCHNYNRDVNIPDTVLDCSNMFYSCIDFNSAVHLGNNVVNCVNMFSNCNVLNKSITIPDSALDISQMFLWCSNLNSPITIGNNVTNAYDAFCFCVNLAAPITLLSNNVLNYSRTFYDCYRFNSSVNLESANDCSSMFYRCVDFNRPVVLGNNIQNCVRMFYNCVSFNHPIVISDSVTNCYGMFDGCVNFNSPVHIGNNVTNCAHMFNWCSDFDQDIYVPDSVGTNFYGMLTNALNFNSNISIPTIPPNYGNPPFGIVTSPYVGSLNWYSCNVCAGVHTNYREVNRETEGVDFKYDVEIRQLKNRAYMTGTTIHIRDTGEIARIVVANSWDNGMVNYAWEFRGNTYFWGMVNTLENIPIIKYQNYVNSH